jgi:hypothetical protein
MSEAYIIVKEIKVKGRKRSRTFTEQTAVVVADSPKEAADILGAEFVKHDPYYYQKHGYDPNRFDITFKRKNLENLSKMLNSGWNKNFTLSSDAFEDVFERWETQGIGASELSFRVEFDKLPRRRNYPSAKFYLKHALHISKS